MDPDAGPDAGPALITFRNPMILSPDEARDKARHVLALATPARPEPASSLSDLLDNAISLFADALLVPSCGGAPIPAHCAILLQDALLSVDLASAPDGPRRQYVDEEAPALLARVRSLYGCAPPGAGAWHGSAALRAHLLRLAAASAVDAPPASHLADAVVRTAQGEALRAHRCVLAASSEYFRAAFAHAEREGRPADVTVGCSDTPAGLLALLLRYLYSGHLDDAAAGLTSELVVHTCRLADQLLLWPLRARALELMLQAVDSSNAPSLFQVAVCLQESGLVERCVEQMVRAERELAGSEHFAELPDDVQALIHSLARASRANPLCTNAPLAWPREFLAILRESLDEQVARHEHALRRQREEETTRAAQRGVHAAWAELRASPEELERDARVHRALSRREAQICMLREYVRSQEAAFLGLSDDGGLCAVASSPSRCEGESDHGC